MKRYLFVLGFFLVSLTFQAFSQSDTVWIKNMKQYGESQVNDIRFSPDDNFVFVLASKGIYMFETESGNFIKSFQAKYINKTSEFFSFDTFNDGLNLIALSYWDSLLVIWNIENVDTSKTIKLAEIVKAVRLTADNNNLLIAFYDSLVEYSLNPWKYIRTLRNGSEPWSNLICSKDGKYIASAFSKNTNSNSRIYWVSIFDGLTYYPIANYNHPTQINDLKFSNDGKYLASCGESNTLVLWDLERNKVKDTLHSFNNDASIFAITFSPNSKYLAYTIANEEPFYTYIYNLNDKYISYKYNCAFTRLEASKNSKYILGTDSRDVCMLKTHWDQNLIKEVNYYYDSILIYPNPFNGNSQLTINLPSSTIYQLFIKDDNGKIVWSELNKFIENGNHLINLSTSTLASGVYYCQIFSDRYNRTIKLILVK